MPSATTQTKKLLIIGPTGVGKSTIINQITNSSLTIGDTSAHANISSVNCSYNGIEYELFDILGWFAAESESITDQVVTTFNAYKQLKQTIQKLDFGIHMLICVISDKKVTKNDVATIQLIYEHVFSRQIPLVLIVNNKHYKLTNSSSIGWIEKHEKEISETFGNIFVGKYEMAFPKLTPLQQTAQDSEEILKEKERVSTNSKTTFFEKVLTHSLQEGVKNEASTISTSPTSPRKSSPLVEIVKLCEKVNSKQAQKEISSALQNLYHIPEQQALKEAEQIIKECNISH
ncbi:predicted protein [Naegleria gruberi]|uniref:Predicted protein n=1 Tax=Naegleria gruberi TaxID=5762 RepID=D2VLC7_NAEGR|nr:uncharacterized protein NAEGRDRAFT_69733 [Naegleria gruberi]EFC42365.1 predicted protein [Naegleria gruberi]|eukprot:XP_002675109.1 predicted protein [Naegleria gruberi strain NEG-M]